MQIGFLGGLIGHVPFVDWYIRNISITLTRYGDIFTGDGVTGGARSFKSTGLSLSAGYMLCPRPSRGKLNNFFTDWSASAGGYDVVGGAITINQSGAAANVGLGFGGVGFSPASFNKYRGNVGDP